MFTSLISSTLCLLLLAFVCRADDFIDNLVNFSSLPLLMSQMSQLDIQSLMDSEGQLNTTLLTTIVANFSVGSLFNSPNSGAGRPPTLDEWRTLMDTIYNISTTTGSRIPILYGLDSVHGANYIFNATIFPQQIGMAATFNRTAVETAGRITGRETRAAGIPWVFSPILGLAVDPQWARVYETFGEDPFLVSTMGVSIITGLQSAPPAELNASYGYTVAACMKHYIGYPNLRTGRDRTPVWLPMNHLLQYFAPSFQAAIDAGALSAMENYIEINGRPVVASGMLLNLLLRDVQGFQGMLVTDYNEMFNLFDFHHGATSYGDAVRRSLNATTIDMAMISGLQDFPYTFVNLSASAVNEELVSRNRIRDSVRRVLNLKQQLGLFEGSPVPPLDRVCLFACDSHREAGLDTARQAIVLLQNNHSTLPLDAASLNNPTQRVAVVGRACDSVPLLAGGWTIHWQGTSNASMFPYGMTVLQYINATLPAAQVIYASGCSVLEDSACTEPELAAVIAAVEQADLVIACVGERHYAEKPGDITNITLPGQQIFMMNVINGAKPIDTNLVTVLVEGRPRILGNIPDISDAVIMAFLPGPSGGQAIGEILFGVTNPSGRLPITYPSEISNAPIQYWRKFSANTGSDYTVQWPFGHGLSYSNVVYESMDVVNSVTSDGNYHVNVTLRNDGPYPVAEVIQVYVQQPYRSITPEVQLLAAFDKVHLEVGERAVVSMSVLFTAFSYYDEFNCRTIDAGEVLFFLVSPQITNPGDFIVNQFLNFSYRFSCEAWGKYFQANTGVAGSIVTPVPEPRKSSIPDYLISSIVCFGAGIVGTVFIVAFLRRRHQRQAGYAMVTNKLSMALEPTGV